MKENYRDYSNQQLTDAINGFADVIIMTKQNAPLIVVQALHDELVRIRQEATRRNLKCNLRRDVDNNI